MSNHAIHTEPSYDQLCNDHPMRDGRTTTSALITNYRGRRCDARPVWFMRQAGRSLPEYKTARGDTPMLTACLTPELVAEITCQPVRRHHVDAGIFYSDIVIPVKLAGLDVEIVPGVGPVVDQPIRSKDDLDRLHPIDDVALTPIREAVGLTVAELQRTPLIGFAGAPFTVASYLIEGRPSRDYALTLAMMRNDPETWDSLLSWVADITGAFLRAQGIAGASALQLFDSWAGALSTADYRRFVQPYSARVLASVADLGLPRIHFGTKTGHLLRDFHDAGADVVGIYTDTTLATAAQLLPGVPLQGNIDPALLAGPWQQLETHTRQVLLSGAQAPGHVVNLGHGVPPTTDASILTRLVELIHSIPEEAN